MLSLLALRRHLKLAIYFFRVTAKSLFRLHRSKGLYIGRRTNPQLSFLSYAVSFDCKLNTESAVVVSLSGHTIITNSLR